MASLGAGMAGKARRHADSSLPLQWFRFVARGVDIRCLNHNVCFVTGNGGSCSLVQQNVREWLDTS